MKSFRQLVSGIMSFYFFSFLLGGLLEAVSENGVSEKITLYLIPVASYPLVTALLDRMQLQMIQRKKMFGITLSYGEKKCEICGLYDTGNLLRDPITGKPVSVIKAKALFSLIEAEKIQRLKYITVNPEDLKNTELLRLKPHLLPFHSVGKKEGMLVAITLDELCIHTPKEDICIASPVFALQYDTPALDGEYEVLLNSGLL